MARCGIIIWKGRVVMTGKHPDKDECLRMLELYNTPAHVVRHCIAVTDTAVRIASALNEKGYGFDIPLIQAAGMLHDIARVEKEHWKSGAQFVLRSGYKPESRIVKKHMLHSLKKTPEKLDELDIVCLGDRLVLEDEYVGVDVRMDYVIRKADGNKRFERAINKNRETNRALVEQIEKITGKSINDIIRGSV